MHTTGTDIKHAPNAVACLTIGKHMTFRDYAQGAYRMRGISSGQRINVLVVPEVEELMRHELDKLAPTPALASMGEHATRLERLICWLIVNTLDSECKQFNFLMQQDLANLYRRRSLHALLDFFPAGEEEASGFAEANAERIAHALECFRERLSLEVDDKMQEGRSFEEMLRERYREKREWVEADAASIRVKA